MASTTSGKQSTGGKQQHLNFGGKAHFGLSGQKRKRPESVTPSTRDALVGGTVATVHAAVHNGDSTLIDGVLNIGDDTNVDYPLGVQAIKCVAAHEPLAVVRLVTEPDTFGVCQYAVMVKGGALIFERLPTRDDWVHTIATGLANAFDVHSDALTEQAGAIDKNLNSTVLAQERVVTTTEDTDDPVRLKEINKAFKKQLGQTAVKRIPTIQAQLTSMLLSADGPWQQVVSNVRDACSLIAAFSTAGRQVFSVHPGPGLAFKLMPFTLGGCPVYTVIISDRGAAKEKSPLWAHVFEEGEEEENDESVDIDVEEEGTVVQATLPGSPQNPVPLLDDLDLDILS